MTSDPQTANAIPWPGGAAQIAGVPAETTPAELDRRLRFMAAAAVADHAATVASDPWRQAFHIQPPTGLLNDPNGLVAHDGTYHVCYQWHPFAPKHALKFWAHVTSTDLVHWSDPAIALAPSQPYESHGCYSGSGVVVDDAVHFFYTGNVRTPNGGRTPFQLLATLSEAELTGAEGMAAPEATATGAALKSPANPLVGAIQGCTSHVRDPKVWSDERGHWMILGAQTEDLHGTALLLHSADLLEWTLLGSIAGGASEPLGYMWECPDLIRLSGREILVISPQFDNGGTAPTRWEDVSVYAVGALAGDPPRFERGTDFRRIDAGPDFYAPQSFVAEDGRTIMVGWMGMPDHDGQPTLAEKHPTAENGWVHCLTVPRELALDADVLLQRPVSELISLRGEPVHLADVEITPSESLIIEPGQGPALDIELSAICSPGGTLTVRMRDGEADRPALLILDPHAGTATLDRTRLGTGEGGTFTGRFRPSTKVEVRILLDHSSVEVFVDGGRLTMSARIYPVAGDDVLAIDAAGSAASVSMTVWPMSMT